MMHQVKVNAGSIACVLLLCACGGTSDNGAIQDTGGAGSDAGLPDAGTVADAGPSGLTFPPGFAWGVSTSAFQTEGGIDDDYTDWIAAGKSPAYGVACDFWNRYEADLANAASLGVTFFRMSLEWSRIEPVQGQWDTAAVAHYRQILQAVRDHGRTPLVTLHHFTNPKWVAAAGWWEWDGIVDAFAAYAGYAAEQFGDLVDHWNPMNEPMVYVSGWSLVEAFPGGKMAAYDSLHRVFHNAVYANARAYDAIHAKDTIDADGDGKPAQVWLVYAVSPMHPDDPASQESVDAAARMDYYNNRAFPNALVNGALDLDFDGKTDKTVAGLQEGVFDDLKGRVDLIGVNYYNREFVTPAAGLIPNVDAFPCVQAMPCGKPNRYAGDNGNEIYPPGIYETLKEFSAYGLPIYVSENGVVDADDDTRPFYLVMHLMQVHRAIAEGIDVRGYLHWSLLDNYEWTSGYKMKFGLYGVDLDTQSRTERPSAGLYRAIATGNTLPDALIGTYDKPNINPMK